MPTRRTFLTLAAAPLVAASDYRNRTVSYLAGLARPGGGYGWGPETDAHLTPTYFVVAAMRTLGAEPPDKHALAEWIRTHNPLPERRHTERPLHRFWLEQIQAIQWLGGDASSFRAEISAWTRPLDFLKQYELNGNPVFQLETAGLRCRHLLGLPATEEWRDYVLSRRRPDGTFNNTPASDGSGSHVMNTLWGVEALDALGVSAEPAPKLVEWTRACQLPNGGFTWAPHPSVGGVDDVAYTWAALELLHRFGAVPSQPEACARYLASLWNDDGGFGDRPGRLSNPMATCYAVASLQHLGAQPQQPRPRPAARTLPSGLRPFTIQIEAPGNGSPAEAVEMARALGIHIWAAKNSQPGWIERAQQVAGERKVQVLFTVGNEEYGNYVIVPGLGIYSHLADLVAPPGVDFGAAMTDPKKPVPWAEFRDRRIGAVRRAGGRMIWQFNENEELTRALLDEAVETGTYAAVSTYHFGIENFQHTQPFLMRYYDVLPFVSLQDAHAGESWWWGDQLEGFRTVFLAAEPTWEQWLEALARQCVMAICRDARTNFETRVAGGDPALRAAVLPWWERAHTQLTRPPALLTVIRAGDAFESAAPASGALLRVRLRHQNSTQGLPLAPVTELVELTLDGRATPAPEVRKENANHRVADVYLAAPLDHLAPGPHVAVAKVRDLATGRTSEVRESFRI